MRIKSGFLSALVVLTFVFSALAIAPEIKDDADQAALAIAQKIGSKGGNTEGLLKRLAKADLGKVKLEIVKAEYGAAMKVIATGGLAPLFAEGTLVI